MPTTKTQTITSGGYTFPIPRRERDRLLHSMTPDARAWFYSREYAALTHLNALNEAEEADAAYEARAATSPRRSIPHPSR